MLGNSFFVVKEDEEDEQEAESLTVKGLDKDVQELMEQMEHMDNTVQEGGGVQAQHFTTVDDAKVEELLSALCAAEATLAQLSSSPSKKPLPLPLQQEQEANKANDEVDSDIHDLQSSLESIKNQLDLLEGKKESDSTSTPSSPNNGFSSNKRKRVYSLSNEGSPIPRAPPRRLPADPDERKEHVRRSRATPLHEGFRCEYCSDAETPMYIALLFVYFPLSFF